MNKRLIIGLSLVGALGACTSAMTPAKIGGAPNLQVLADSVLPEPTMGDYRGVMRPYAIGPFDKVRVDVAGLPELSLLEVQTDAGGNIAVPLAGTVQVAGLTADEAAKAIRDRLRAAHVRDPRVTVNLRDTNSQVFTVEGQVMKPGQYPALGNMTLLNAVAKAEGATEFARLDDVIIFRTVNGQRYAALYNLKAIRRGAYGDPAVFANDTIVVGDSPQRRLFRDILQVVPLITTPLVVALQNNN